MPKNMPEAADPRLPSPTGEAGHGAVAGPPARRPGQDLRELLARAREQTNSTLPKLPHTMLSDEEVRFLWLYLEHAYRGVGLIAELGAFVGGTSALFAEGLRKRGLPTRVEVYDYFKHNKRSRTVLRGQPGYDEDGFFGIWQNNTEPYRDLLVPFVGELQETATASSAPIELLFVDIVKHGSVINTVMRHFVSRLVVRGVLVHQDYYHWMSPWVVYSTELLGPHLRRVGHCRASAIFQLKSLPDPALLTLDYEALDWEQKLALMDAAIARHAGRRAELLRVSRFNLGLDWPGFDSEKELATLRASLTDANAKRYLEAAAGQREPAAAGARDLW